MSKNQAKENRSKYLKNEDFKKKVYTVAFILLILLMIVIARNSEVTSITNWDKISTGGITQVHYGQYLENGLNYEFTTDELNEIKEILSTSKMVEIAPLTDVSNIDFLVHFYDSNNNALFGLFMSNTGKIYYNNSHMIKTDAVEEYFNRYRLYSLGLDNMEYNAATDSNASAN